MANRFEIPGVAVSNTCFLPQVNERSWFFLRLYRHYQNNHLFAEGGLMSQPNVYLQAMETIDAQK